MQARIVSALLSQRSVALGSIVAVHGAIAYAMANGLAYATSEIATPPVQTVIVPEIPRSLMQRESLPAPEMKRLRVEVPPPEVKIDIPLESNAITDVTTGMFAMMTEKKAPLPSGPASKPALRYIIHARVSENFPNPDAFYPPASIRREEQGLVGVQVCVGVDGKLLDMPSVAKTSGSARLDEAALKLARSGRYLAGSVDGVPIIDCMQLPIRFKVKS
jgi:protein TonB